MDMFAELSPNFWIIVVIFFGAVYTGLIMAFATSQVRGGWRPFAKRFRAAKRPAGEAHDVISCWILKLHDNSSGLRVILSDEGIYLYKTFPFRVACPPLLVPWKNVKSVQKGTGFFGEYYILDIEDTAGTVRLNLPKLVSSDLSKYYQLT